MRGKTFTPINIVLSNLALHTTIILIANSQNKKQSNMAPNPLIAPSELLQFLQTLHTESLTQESSLEWPSLPEKGTPAFDTIMLDKFIALDQDKCELIYHILRSINAKTVVEAGTSFGVSTIYLALAVAQNTCPPSSTQAQGRVIATEKEASKAARAQQNWALAGAGVQDVIELRVGDLRETLTTDLGDVDFLLLDSELSLASLLL